MTTPQILAINLRRSLRLDKNLELMNVFRGVPVLYPAGVDRLTDDQVDIFFDRPEAICLKLEKQTTILNASLDEPIGASVLSVDLAAGTARLGKLRVAGSHLGERMILRVEPAAATRARLDAGGRRLSADILDLSMNGLGLHLEPDDGEELRTGMMTRLEVPLPDLRLRLTGTVRYARQVADGWRAGVTFVPGSQAGEILSYIRQRHDDILAELPRLHQALVEQARG